MLVVIVPPVLAALVPVEALVFLDAAPAALVAHVVRGDVEDDGDAVRVHLVDQVLEVLEGAHAGVAAEEVVHVVLVVRGPALVVDALVVLLDAADPDGGDAHALEVGDLQAQAVPVAAVVVVAVEGVAAVEAVAGVLAVPPRPVVLDEVVAVGGEAVGEQLVDVAVAPLLRTGSVGEAGFVLAGNQRIGAAFPAVPIPSVWNVFLGPSRSGEHSQRADGDSDGFHVFHGNSWIQFLCCPFILPLRAPQCKPIPRSRAVTGGHGRSRAHLRNSQSHPSRLDFYLPPCQERLRSRENGRARSPNAPQIAQIPSARSANAPYREATVLLNPL